MRLQGCSYKDADYQVLASRRGTRVDSQAGQRDREGHWRAMTSKARDAKAARGKEGCQGCGSKGHRRVRAAIACMLETWHILSRENLDRILY